MKGNEKLDGLLGKPLCMMTGEEFLQLNELARHDAAPAAEPQKTYAHGIGELAGVLGCSESTIYSLKKQGALDDAIVSNIGRKILFDVGKARALADEYQKNAREERHG